MKINQKIMTLTIYVIATGLKQAGCLACAKGTPSEQFIF